MDISKPCKTFSLKSRPSPAVMALLAVILLSAALGISRSFFKEKGPLEGGSHFSVLERNAEETEGSFAESLRVAMARITEASSAVQSFNILAAQWKVQPIGMPTSSGKEVELESLASGRSLEISRQSGNLGSLLRANSPAILELDVPGISGKRYLALTGLEGDRLLVSPVLAGRNYMTPSELESIWSGRYWMIWKNSLDIPSNLKPDDNGDGVSRLQYLLRDAGAYSGPVTGVFDRETTVAVQNFQSLKGIEPDGVAGKNTLMLLYRSAKGYFPPELTKKGSQHQR